MTTQLYNMQPSLQMLAMVAVVLFIILSWVWIRTGKSAAYIKVQRLTLLVLFLTFDLIVFGAFTRLTDSGLGCPDWPGCYGTVSPVQAHANIEQAQTILPDGPVTHKKAWIEMIHRYLAMTVGGLILILAVLALQQRRQQSIQAKKGINWPVISLLWVCLQGAFGALTVTTKLWPIIVSLHLIGGIVLLGLLAIQAIQCGAIAISALPVLPASLKRWAWLAWLIVSVQIFLGAWVSTNYAVLACDTFPLCQGSWWPEMSLDGFELWRPLGYSSKGEILAFSSITAIHFIHRIGAALVTTLLIAFVWQLHKQPSTAKKGRWLLALMLIQVSSGISNVILGWPLWAALIHTGTAALLWVTLLIWLDQ